LASDGAVVRDYNPNIDRFVNCAGLIVTPQRLRGD
jgi:hypothetical protein